MVKPTKGNHLKFQVDWDNDCDAIASNLDILFIFCNNLLGGKEIERITE